MLREGIAGHMLADVAPKLPTMEEEKSTNMRSMGEEIQRRNIKTIQLRKPAKRKLDPNHPSSVICIASKPTTASRNTHTLHPAKTPTSAHVS